ncbi:MULTISPECIES: YqaA family protein [Pseudoalteromonas]|jgi:membrane protein YqaA with SNARE-associated domain|uniref:VTT domain-containing protein n=1 Tax=Pseudoalteromonas shioyasakiensis TaxID=1190813 RepID=A0ABT6U1T6_9GAMM|nr:MULTISPECIES: VTT domain-containing protein [Pseudoalteromonas]KPW01633.1 SNARE associated Golgi protein [Pseudoalteromonas sp. P1-8]KPZ72365.1 SNARE associated Golgi protein [Pseudoalteromonas sp. P1-26]KZY59547.1 alkaline phosphatase [Pseudoalteromonas shioyasakiensis]MCF2900553.1 VTT domain-containing protein [Pseudoalteromonas sp. OFAV1]MCG9733297.1 VTT domain-containing protein [Pseudoalteromonas shioyasakiensis]|tara:strand:- start:149 stop:733 length:585 start_codon:yes stop_codon:yes gene_type:complete
MAIAKKLKQKTRQFIDSKHMLKSITVASFLESTIVPIPLEAVLVPLMQARREKLWLIALMATIGCIIGAIFGYALGYYLFDVVGDWVINTFSNPEQFEQVKQKMQAQGFWFVLTLGIVPIPFQIAMLAAGATKYSIFLFLLATVIARSIRYFALAAVVYYAGNQAERVIQKHKTKALVAISVLVLLLWWLSTLI